jgi:hypothetical protein
MSIADIQTLFRVWDVFFVEGHDVSYFFHGAWTGAND